MLPQSIPVDMLVTVPLPMIDTVSTAWLRAKFAVQDLFAFMLTLPPVQSVSPVQPVKTEFASGIGVKLTVCPDG